MSHQIFVQLKNIPYLIKKYSLFEQEFKLTKSIFKVTLDHRNKRNEAACCQSMF